MNTRTAILRRGDRSVAPTTHRRRSLRLPRFDYTQQGAYFVTVCTRNRACVFGEIVNGEMQLNDSGRVAHRVWEEIPTHFLQVEIDAWVVMPNHVHGVLVITGPHVGATHASPLLVADRTGGTASDEPDVETEAERRRRMLREVFEDFDARAVGLRMSDNLTREELHDRARAEAQAAAAAEDEDLKRG